MAQKSKFSLSKLRGPKVKHRAQEVKKTLSDETQSNLRMLGILHDRTRSALK